jgi:UDP-N-acetylmuramoyl-L-alanyl-D-glutamate--2,6-diaminopimelate ligase
VSRRLADLGLEAPPGLEGLEVSALTADSREAGPGVVFFALRGARDGAAFGAQALAAGSPAAVCDAAGAATIRAEAGERAPLIVVETPRRALALAAAALFGAQPEVMAAVTGTNGKTSVTWFLRQIWQALGRRAVNFGTTGVHGAVEAPGTLTTPDPVRLHRLLADLAAEGVSHAAMEASSHGLAQHRADGVRLRAGGLTNIARDHLDYHATQEDYVAAKLALFGRVLPEGATAAINADDPVFDRAAGLARSRGQRVIGVGRAAGADLRLLSAGYHETGQTLRFSWEGREHVAELPLIGGFQGENALMAAALAIACGEDAEAVFQAVPRLSGVAGRMELAATRANGARVFVDYAHTPASLETALAALRRHTPGRLSAAFGAGGDRDAGKRPLMGAAAARVADDVIVTDDNPRGEDPAAIRAAVLEACPGAREIGDRAEAIRQAVAALGPGDRLLIAGKGHETGQIIGDRVLAFDDVEQARAAVAALDGEPDADRESPA